MEENVEKLFRFGKGWLVKIRYRHRTTNVPDMVWLSDEFFDMPRSDQISGIKKIKPFVYNPVDSGGDYLTAWHFLYTKNDFDFNPNEKPDDLLARVVDKFGIFSSEWYCAKIIENHAGWQKGECKFPEPIPDPDGKFSAGFLAGYLFSEALWKNDLEIDAMRGISTRNAARAGVKERRGKLELHTSTVLAEMERLIADEHSINRAAELTAKRGIGRSKNANRALWYRHRKKKL